MAVAPDAACAVLMRVQTCGCVCTRTSSQVCVHTSVQACMQANARNRTHTHTHTSIYIHDTRRTSTAGWPSRMPAARANPSSALLLRTATSPRKVCVCHLAPPLSCLPLVFYVCVHQARGLSLVSQKAQTRTHPEITSTHTGGQGLPTFARALGNSKLHTLTVANCRLVSANEIR